MKATHPARLRALSIVVLLECLTFTSPAHGLDARFHYGHKVLTIPFELDANVIFLRVSLNGSPPLSFILDTGSYSIISTRHAKSLGLGLQRVGKTDSIGAEPQDVYLVKDRASFNLHGFEFSGQRLLAISLDKVQECIDRATEGGRELIQSSQSESEVTRRVLDGILGKEFFSMFVVEIDYTGRKLNVYEPATYKYMGQGKSFSLEMEPQHIFVRAQIKHTGRPPITARLLVDTGAATALRLTKQFTDVHKLLPPLKKLSEVPECGLGGYASEKAWEGTLEALRLGDFKVSNPSTVFSRLPTHENYDGFLGGLALRNFKVVFDYSRRRMILEPASRGARMNER